MKRGTTPTIRIQHDLDMSTVKRVDFLFKQNKNELEKAILVKTYNPSDTSAEVNEQSGVFRIPLTADETRLFKSGTAFYCDPRITLVNGDIPETEILTLQCCSTLWGENDG